MPLGFVPILDKLMGKAKFAPRTVVVQAKPKPRRDDAIIAQGNPAEAGAALG